MRKRALLVLSATMIGAFSLCANPARAAAPGDTSRLTLDRPLLLTSAAPLPCPTHDAALCLRAPVLGLEALNAGWLRWSLDPLPAPTLQNAPAPVTRPPPALGGQLQLGQGRELSVQITPTPRRCAPLVKLTF